VTVIEDRAFYGCRSLQSVVVPDSVDIIKSYTFADCSSLNKVTLPDQLTRIYAAAFYRCSSLCSIKLPKTLISIGGAAFAECSSLSSVSIPDNVWDIEQSAFAGCTALKTISLGSGLKFMYYDTFGYCHSVEDVYCYATAAPYCDQQTFQGVPFETAVLHVPDSALHSYQETEPWKNFALIVGIESEEKDVPAMLSNSPSWTYHSRVYDRVTYPMPIGYTNAEIHYSLSDSVEKNGKTYLTLTREEYDVTAKPGSMQANRIAGKDYSLGIREEGGRIFVDADEFQALYGDKSTVPYEQVDDEYLIYDFTLKKGEFFGAGDVFVENIDVVKTMDGVDRKLYVLSSGHKILEGIGCLYSEGELINYLAYPPVEETSIGWKYTFLGNYLKNDEIIYGISSEDVDQLITNIDLQQIRQVDSNAIYDLSGRRVANSSEIQGSSKLPKGVYIQSGKKFVVK
jgi:hypothetical protein